MSYKKIECGEWRQFSMTIGLERGYGTGTSYAPERVQDLFEAWVIERMTVGKRALTCATFVPAKISYAWQTPDGPKMNREDAVISSGDVNPLYNADLTDRQVIELLEDLADYIGRFLGQTRMYIGYRGKRIGRLRVYQESEAVHPTEVERTTA